MIKRKKTASILSLLLSLTLITTLAACAKSSEGNTRTKDAISSELEANEASPDKNKTPATNDKKPSSETQTPSDKNNSPRAFPSEEESKKTPEMNSNELELYNEFIKAYDTSLLKDINPVTIFKFFSAALKADNLKAQFALYAKTGDAPAPATYEEFTSKLKEDSSYNDSLKADMKTFQENFNTLKVKYSDKDSVTMEINFENGWEVGFGLYKAPDGVWKVRWYPVTT